MLVDKTVTEKDGFGIPMDYDELMASWTDASGGGPGSRQILGWVSTASIESRCLTDIGGWGGFMTEAMRWHDYIAGIDPKFCAHHEALRQAIIARGLRRGGEWHQNAQDGVPVFDDGTVGTFSFRSWGDLMAATWSGEDGHGYSYMHFCMDSCLEEAGMVLSPPSNLRP